MNSLIHKLAKLKRLVPVRFKSAVKDALLKRKLRQAIREISSLRVGEMPTMQMLRDLQIGWGNSGFAARTEYLAEVAREAVTTTGPIIECGSGVTTILLGLLAGRRGVKTYSLEHTPEWRTLLLGTLEKFRITQVRVCLTPLREYEGFDWYDTSNEDLPSNFSLAICDGPPGEVKGGRYGLLPVLARRLGPGATVMLDDTERAGEAEVLRRWAQETDFFVSTRASSDGSFAVLTLNAVASRAPISKASRPVVSVIIPAYKVAPFIGETLDSVFAQTFTDYEVIVVNDGSPDTIELEQVLKPSMNRIRYLKQDNRGASAARNAGLLAARGEFIAFLDADDLWLPNYLEAQLNFRREDDCDLVCADAMIFGNSPDAGRTYMDTVMPAAPQSARVSFADLLSADRSLITSGVVVRREPVLAVGLFDEGLRNAQDFDLWLRLAQQGLRLSYHRTVLLRYRGRPDSLTGDAINSHRRELRVLEKVEQAYDLSADERAEVFPVIRGRKAHIEFELGKLHLAQGNVEHARRAFVNARKSQPHWKPQVALWMSHLAPGLMQNLCHRRMQCVRSD